MPYNYHLILHTRIAPTGEDDNNSIKGGNNASSLNARLLNKRELQTIILPDWYPRASWVTEHSKPAHTSMVHKNRPILKAINLGHISARRVGQDKRDVLGRGSGIGGGKSTHQPIPTQSVITIVRTAFHKKI